MNWYDLSEEERIKEVYSKFTLKDFWKWWSDNKERVMEIRIKDFELIKEVAKLYYIPYSSSGVYVKNDHELYKVVSYVRDKAAIWFGANPRRRMYNRFGTKQFGGKDINVAEIAFLFIDVDRIKKEKEATQEELKGADTLAGKFLEVLGSQGWDKNYIKICTGNGVQLFVKLDIPIQMPTVDFINETKEFIYNSQYEDTRRLIIDGIGKQIIKFNNIYKDIYHCEIDKSCFNPSHVGSLPMSKNFKYGGFRWRGIIEIKNGVNDGLSDYVISSVDKREEYKRSNVFVVSPLSQKNIMIAGKLRENPLVFFMLNNKLPEGMRNNYLWMQLKCLIRDSKIDVKSEEFRSLHKEIEAKHGTLTWNIPDKKFSFDENIINSYCIKTLMPPIFTINGLKTKKKNMIVRPLKFDSVVYFHTNEQLNPGTDIKEDLYELKQTLIEGDLENNLKIYTFLYKCLKKYGEERTRYYAKYIVEPYLSYF